MDAEKTIVSGVKIYDTQRKSKVNEFNECVHEVFSAAGDIIISFISGLYMPVELWG